MPSSETETHSRGRLALDRDGRSRVVRPSSETDPHSRGRSTHERGGFVPRRCRIPRADRSSTRGWLGRLSDGPWAHRFVLCVCLGSFSFIFYEFKQVSPGCLVDPHGCPQHICISFSFLRKFSSGAFRGVAEQLATTIAGTFTTTPGRRERKDFSPHTSENT
jgi:hypothetical protein